MADTAKNPAHRKKTQSLAYMENMSFDDVFEVLTRLALTYNPVSNTVERVTGIQGNASLALSYTDGNLTRIDKTVGAITYRKTLTWTDGNLTGMSTWSQV